MTQRLPQPDFLRPVRQPGWLAWAACASALLVLAVAALDSHQAWLDRAGSLARLAGAQQRIKQRPAAQRPAEARSTDNRPAEARRWLTRLAHPWPVIWSASEVASVGGISWLGLAHSERGLLQLDGQALDAGAALAAAMALRDQRHKGAALWRDVVLTRIEKTPDGQRFEIVAQLVSSRGAAP